MCPRGYLILAYRGVTSSRRVVIANFILSDHMDIIQELELEESLEEHLHF